MSQIFFSPFYSASLEKNGVKIFHSQTDRHIFDTVYWWVGVFSLDEICYLPTCFAGMGIKTLRFTYRTQTQKRIRGPRKERIKNNAERESILGKIITNFETNKEMSESERERERDEVK